MSATNLDLAWHSLQVRPCRAAKVQTLPCWQGVVRDLCLGSKLNAFKTLRRVCGNNLASSALLVWCADLSIKLSTLPVAFGGDETINMAYPMWQIFKDVDVNSTSARQLWEQVRLCWQARCMLVLHQSICSMKPAWPAC